MSEVLKIIDSKTDELDPIFREFNVLHTEGARRRSARLVSITGFQSSESVVVLWLAGLCAFLVALLVLVVCLCLHQRSKYLRKLRAASCQPSSSTPYDAVLPPSAATQGGIRPVSSSAVPNTNKHTTEGSNPVWMRNATDASYDNHISFDHEDLEEEDLDDNALRSHHSHIHQRQLDSLDINVLNQDNSFQYQDLDDAEKDRDVGNDREMLHHPPPPPDWPLPNGYDRLFFSLFCA